MATLVFVSVFCVVAVLVYMARYSGRLRVEQTRLVDAPLETVLAKVGDLRQWQQWNPWLDNLSGGSVTVSELDGGRCAWESAHSGAGLVDQVTRVAKERMGMRLRLRHPFAVTARTAFTFQDHNGKTQVTWTLRGRVAFSMRAFAPTVQGSLVLDCRLGLDRLASLVEPAGAPRYVIEHLGLCDVASVQYVCREYQGPISGLSGAMRNSLAALNQELIDHGLKASGVPMIRYFKTNIRLRTTACHIAIPVESPDHSTSLPVRQVAALRAYVVRLRGSHAGLEIAWYLAMQRMVAQKIRPDQRLPPFECYRVQGADWSENEWVTELHVPVLP